MEILEKELDDDQRPVCCNLLDNQLILAGPGSGKTRLLVHRVGYILRASDSGCSKVLALTFTNEAAKEMRARLKNIVPSKAQRRLWCGNFHQFCQYVLRHYGHLVGLRRDFTILSESNIVELADEVLNDLGIEHVNAESLVQSISRFRGKVNPPDPEELGIRTNIFSQILELYSSKKRSINALDFDDLIIDTIELLRRRPDLVAILHDTYDHICLDELQDTSLLQLELVKFLYKAGKTKMFAVADEDQILYEWRDARLATIGEYENEFSAKVNFLVLNYRSPESIVRAADVLISNNEGRRDRALKSTVKDREGYIGLYMAESPQEEAEFVAKRISQGISRDGRSPKDFVVLARVHNMLSPTKGMLDTLELPYAHIGDRELRRSAPVKLLLASIAALANWELRRERLVKPIAQVNSILEQKVLILNEFLDLLYQLGCQSLHQFTDGFIKETGLLTILDDWGLPEQIRRLQVACNIVKQASYEPEIRDYCDLNVMLSFEWVRLETRVLRAEDSVKVMTVHQAKGLEFPIVHIVRLEDGAFPLIRKNARLNEQEERRLLFVAITRAEDEVVFSLSRVNDWGYPSLPSRFLSEIPENLIDVIS